jgi:septal ring factor EnvC (AmiA/AmiB activator)
MERLKKFGGNKLNIKIASVALIAAISLVLVASGCTGQIARVRQNQLQLQSIVQGNVRQINDNSAQIGAVTQAVQNLNKDQAQLQQKIKTIEEDNELIREKLVVVLTQLRDELVRLNSQIKTAGLTKR